MNQDHLWTVEEACRNAYPAREMLLGGWLLRAAGGRARRTNSVNPLRLGPRDPSPIVREAERRYATLGQPALFRVPALAAEMDAALDRLGYGRSAPNRTLWADAAAFPRDAVAGVRCTAGPDRAWFEAWQALNPDVSPDDVAAFEASVAGLLLPAVFAVRFGGGDPVALAYGALDRGILVVEAVVTHPEHRGEGHGRMITAALLGWAGGSGAGGACLQVSADNEPALALYRASGFDRDLYDYHYRTAPPQG